MDTLFKKEYYFWYHCASLSYIIYSVAYFLFVCSYSFFIAAPLCQREITIFEITFSVLYTTINRSIPVLHSLLHFSSPFIALLSHHFRILPWCFLLLCSVPLFFVHFKLISHFRTCHFDFTLVFLSFPVFSWKFLRYKLSLHNVLLSLRLVSPWIFLQLAQNWANFSLFIPWPRSSANFHSLQLSLDFKIVLHFRSVYMGIALRQYPSGFV